MNPAPKRPMTALLIDDCDLATAGLKALMAPHAARITLVEPRAALANPQELDIILYEPVGLSPMGASMLRDLQRASDARTAVFSWVDADKLPTPTVMPHLGKRLSASQIVRSLEEMLEGRYTAPSTPVHTEVAMVEEEVEEEVVATGRPAETPLTPRESDVIALVTLGRSNLEISDELAVSINSVKTYIRSAYRKMGVTRRSQAVLWGVSNGYDQSESTAGTAVNG